MRVAEVDGFAFPREDINAPDLYIPTMAFVSYILLVGFVFGASLQFTPEILGMTASKGLIMLTLEVCFVKAGFYLFNCGNVSILDLVAYCGYKFVGIVINILTGFMFSHLYFIVALYVGLATALFMMRTLTRGVIDPSANITSKNYFVIIIAFFQIIITYYLGLA